MFSNINLYTPMSDEDIKTVCSFINSCEDHNEVMTVWKMIGTGNISNALIVHRNCKARIVDAVTNYDHAAPVVKTHPFKLPNEM